MRLLTLSFLLIALAGTACSSIDEKDQIGTLPKMTFAQLQPLPLDVERVEVKSAVPDQQGTNPISHLSIPEAFDTYAKQRFVGMGGVGSGVLSITLNETRVTKGTKNTDNKWTAWTHLDQTDDYVVTVKSTVRYDAPAQGLYKTATLQQERGLSVPQRTSLAERQRLEQEMVEKLIADFDKQVIPALQSNLQVLSAGSVIQ